MFNEDRAEQVAESSAGYAFNLLKYLTQKEPSAAWDELREMFRNAIQAYCVRTPTWPPLPSNN